ncbi:MAG: penicillin-binding transpeptidase domain-containing protein [Crocinitomicaceae bacterium]
MSKSNNISTKAYALYFIVVVLMLAVLVRVVIIQIGSVVPQSENATVQVLDTKLDSIAPLRGRILTEDGSVLVTSIPLYDLHIDLKVIDSNLFFGEIDSLSYHLSRQFSDHTSKQWEEKLRHARAKNNQYFRIKNKVKYSVYQSVKTFPILKEGKYKGGFIVERYSKSHKPHGILAARSLGYVREGIQPVGIEGAYDEYLAGEYGTIFKKYVNGSWKPVSENVKDPVNGADVITAIDVDIQDLAETELMKQMKYQDAEHGVVVLMEVQTGYIKAIANLSKTKDGSFQESYNHAIGTKSVPGSTFKLASLMALLEDNKADIDQLVKAYGQYNFYESILHDSDPKGYGQISLKHAFELSSNVISKVVQEAYQNDEQKFVDRLRSFGIGDPLGIDLKGEPIPTLNNEGEGSWSGISVPWMSIGYEVEQTPLQTLAFYNAVANNGQFIRPLFVKEVRKDGEVLKRFEKAVLKDEICSKNTLTKLRACLEGVVENGTGRKLQSAHFKIAGKTGTVKLSNDNQGYGETSKYQASFCGYFPADRPKYSCIVVIAGPTQQIYGAQVSGVVFKAIADKVYANSLQYHESFNDKRSDLAMPSVKYGSREDIETALNELGVKYVNKAVEEEWAVVIGKPGNVQIEKRYVGKTSVPNVVGMTINDAVHILENKGLRVLVEGSGEVKKQSINPGSRIVKGQQIKLNLG